MPFVSVAFIVTVTLPLLTSFHAGALSGRGLPGLSVTALEAQAPMQIAGSHPASVPLQ
jgi:hypothetical protein